MSARRPFGPGDFEDLWRTDDDPWDFATSAYEQEKYARTLAACGQAPLGDVLELASANGVFSAMLAPHCVSLTTLECAPSAVRLARERLHAAGLDAVDVREGLVPDDLPAAPAGFDVIVASEVLYYLGRPTLDRAVDRLVALLRPGGRLVAVHWTPDAPDHALPGRVPHEVLRARTDLERIDGHVADSYLLDVLVRP